MTGFTRNLGRKLLNSGMGRRLLKVLEANSFESALRSKWEMDRAALSIDARAWPLYETIHRFAWTKLRRFPNLIKPENFNDRVHWLMLFDQRVEMIRCSDKIGVREFVERRIGGEFLPSLYGTFDSVNHFADFELPPECVVKTTHDSGTVFLHRPENRLCHDLVRPRIENALRNGYGTEKGEWPYRFVRPQIMVEELLKQPGFSQPVDIKFHCVEGRVAFIHYICDRDTGAKELILTPEWEVLPVRIYFPLIDRSVPRPSNLEALVEVAEKLSDGFKYVRVDLYNLPERIVVGEMTFFPMSGTYSGLGVYDIEPRMRFSLREHRALVSDGVRLFDE
jgi:hypothetical protein